MSHQFPKSVLCVGQNTVQAVLQEIEKINRFAYADIIELRADYIKEEELTEENLRVIKILEEKASLLIEKIEEGHE